MNTDFIHHLDDYILEHRYRLINSILVYQKGNLVLERYYNKFTSQSRNPIKSIWKSILSLTLGICLDKGGISSIDEPICNYLPQFNEGIHPFHKLITIRHLLTMSSGIYWNGGIHYHCPMLEQMRRSKDWTTYISNVQMMSLPGAVFQYKEWDCILLSAVISKAMGKTAWEICEEYLYKPLSITSGIWPLTKCGINYTVMQGEEQSDLSAQDLGKIGLLMLNKGKWNGKQIVSEEYINQSSLPSNSNKGYGLFWWIKENHFSGQGFGGQEIRIYSQKESVAVIQATPSSSGKFYFDILDKIMLEA